MKKIALLAGMAAALMATESNIPEDYRPKYRKSTPAKLPRKAWKKRKARISAVKKSRQINRA